MKGCFVLLLANTPDQAQTVIAQGEIKAVLGGGSHYLCRMARKGYCVNEVLPLARLESALIFDRQQDLAAFFAENNPPPAAANQNQVPVPNGTTAPAKPDMVCEQHPNTEWPHGDCAGPGMPPQESNSPFVVGADL